MKDILFYLPVIIAPIIVIIISVYLLALYSHPDDNKSAYFAKFCIVSSLVISHIIVLIIPLDASSELNTLDVWITVFIIAMTLIFVFIPISILFYEQDDEDSIKKKCYDVFVQYFMFMVISAILILIGLLLFDEFQIPVEVYTGDMKKATASNSNLNTHLIEDKTQTTLNVDSGIFYALISLINIIGCIICSLYGGAGLLELPMNLIMQFVKRPIMRSSKEMAEKKKNLQQQSAELVELGKTFKNEDFAQQQSGYLKKKKQQNKQRQDIKVLKAQVQTLQDEYVIFDEELNFQQQYQENPFKYPSKLILGLIFFTTSIILIVQILLYVVIDQYNNIGYQFLGKFLNENQGIISTVVFTYFSIYMLWAVMSGIFSLGLGIPYFFTLYPMKQNETLVNSFLVNCAILIITSISVIQLCFLYMNQYIYNTSYATIGIAIQYQKNLNFLQQHKIYFHLILGSFFLNFIKFFCQCRRRKQRICLTRKQKK